MGSNINAQAQRIQNLLKNILLQLNESPKPSFPYTPKTLFTRTLDFKAKGVDVTCSVVCYRNRGVGRDGWDVLSSINALFDSLAV